MAEVGEGCTSTENTLSSQPNQVLIKNIRKNSSPLIPALKTCERIILFCPRLPRMAMRTRQDRCPVWRKDVSLHSGRPREGASPGYRLKRLVPWRALYRTQARPPGSDTSGNWEGRRRPSSRMKIHRTGHGNVSYRLPKGSHLTRHGDVPRPILSDQQRDREQCMVKPRGETARVNADGCLYCDWHSTT
jgi:hypothetical protein